MPRDWAAVLCGLRTVEGLGYPVEHDDRVPRTLQGALVRACCVCWAVPYARVSGALAVTVWAGRQGVCGGRSLGAASELP